MDHSDNDFLPSAQTHEPEGVHLTAPPRTVGNPVEEANHPPFCRVLAAFLRGITAALPSDVVAMLWRTIATTYDPRLEAVRSVELGTFVCQTVRQRVSDPHEFRRPEDEKWRQAWKTYIAVEEIESHLRGATYYAAALMAGTLLRRTMTRQETRVMGTNLIRRLAALSSNERA